ncbi:MAG: 3-hydroxyisobutyryl-CoA hydrolase [Rhodoglobus sp.]
MTTRELADGHIRAKRAGRLGHVILTRPSAINALTTPMVSAITNVLAEWAADPLVDTVVLTGDGSRGLCAGGDIVAMTSGDGGALASVARFLTTEYRLNAMIAHYPKPVVAIMDGIVLGGGVGLSAHGSHRVVTERSKIGMPETAIGFVPDVGASWLLGRAPGHLGTHLALTGSIVSGEDAIAVGLADVMIPSESIDALVEALETADAGSAIARYVVTPPESRLRAAAGWIDRAYAAETAAAIIKQLRATNEPDALAAAETIESRSPSAIVTTLETLRRARSFATLEEALNQEFRVALHLALAPDFAEGVRAQLVDKDRQPKWNPESVDAVDLLAVEAAFEPIGAHPDPLDLPTTTREEHP